MQNLFLCSISRLIVLSTYQSNLQYKKSSGTFNEELAKGSALLHMRIELLLLSITVSNNSNATIAASTELDANKVEQILRPVSMKNYHY